MLSPTHNVYTLLPRIKVLFVWVFFFFFGLKYSLNNPSQNSLPSSLQFIPYTPGVYITVIVLITLLLVLLFDILASFCIVVSIRNLLGNQQPQTVTSWFPIFPVLVILLLVFWRANVLFICNTHLKVKLNSYCKIWKYRDFYRIIYYI